MRMSTRRVDDACHAAPYRTEWGEGRVLVTQGQLVGVELPSGRRRDGVSTEQGGTRLLLEDRQAELAACGAADKAALCFWVEELEAYFAGKRAGWLPAEVPLGGLRLGRFEHAVYKALLAVPPGETVSYGELAEMAGYPRAARAVGNAMAANPIPVVVPCHRVVRSDGTLGRYGNDPEWKARLLAHERRVTAGVRAGVGAEHGS